MKGYDRHCDVVVVGGGMGGMTSALALAKSGMNVEVIERGSNLGGCLTSFEKEGFYFEPCLHVFGDCEEGGLHHRMLKELGLLDKIAFSKVDYTLVTPMGPIVLPRNSEEMIKVLSGQFPEEEQGLKELLSTMRSIYDDFQEFPSPKPVIEKYKEKTFDELLNEFLKSAGLKTMLSSAWLYLALPPSKASAVMGAVFWMHYLFAQGGFFPRGGSKAVVEAFLKELENAQARVTSGSRVTKIVVENSKAVGIETERGERIKADFVISNAAAKQTFLDLVGEKELDDDFVKNIKQIGSSLSSFMVFLGVEMDLTELDLTAQLFVNNSTKSYEDAYESILEGKIDDYVTITIPTLSDPALSPGENMHSLTIWAIAPYRLEGRDWSIEKEKVADEIIKKAESVIPDLSRHIVVKDSVTPVMFEQYTLGTEGATVGWVQTPQEVFARPQQKTPIENLCLAGHWTMPGGGYMLTAKSGIDAAKIILGK